MLPCRAASREGVMKVVIPGGSGQVGTVLARAFHATATRSLCSAAIPRPPWRVVEVGRAGARGLGRGIDGADVVINLAGRSVNCRYTRREPREILESRVTSTRVVGESDRATPTRPPRVWLQASTATIYAHRYDAPNDEATGIIGGGEPHAPDTWRFSIDVARAWERAFDDAVTRRTRKVALRSAMTMSPDCRWDLRYAAAVSCAGASGARRRRPAVRVMDSRRGLRRGGSMADRSRRDRRRRERRGSESAAERRVHARAARRLGVPRSAGPRWMLEIGAVFMRTETELILKSRRVVPARY